MCMICKDTYGVSAQKFGVKQEDFFEADFVTIVSCDFVYFHKRK